MSISQMFSTLCQETLQNLSLQHNYHGEHSATDMLCLNLIDADQNMAA